MNKGEMAEKGDKEDIKVENNLWISNFEELFVCKVTKRPKKGKRKSEIFSVTLDRKATTLYTRVFHAIG